MKLDSRYLHLHEALGLGPMWLSNNAVFRPSENKPIPTAAAHIAQSAPAASTNSAVVSLPALRPSEKPAARIKTDRPPTDTPHRAVAVSDGLPRIETAVKPADLMVVSICPSLEDCTAGSLFSGSVGILLEKMLAAAGFQPERVHKTSWIKTTSVAATHPDEHQINAETPHLRNELERSQARAVLFLGQFFEDASQADNMAQLCGSLPFFVIPHPARLLRRPQLKARAWEELKKLKQLFDQ